MATPLGPAPTDTEDPTHAPAPTFNADEGRSDMSTGHLSHRPWAWFAIAFACLSGVGVILYMVYRCYQSARFQERVARQHRERERERKIRNRCYTYYHSYGDKADESPSMQELLEPPPTPPTPVYRSPTLGFSHSLPSPRMPRSPTLTPYPLSPLSPTIATNSPVLSPAVDENNIPYLSSHLTHSARLRTNPKLWPCEPAFPAGPPGLGIHDYHHVETSPRISTTLRMTNAFNAHDHDLHANRNEFYDVDITEEEGEAVKNTVRRAGSRRPGRRTQRRNINLATPPTW